MTPPYNCARRHIFLVFHILPCYQRIRQSQKTGTVTALPGITLKEKRSNEKYNDETIGSRSARGSNFRRYVRM